MKYLATQDASFDFAPDNPADEIAATVVLHPPKQHRVFVGLDAVLVDGDEVSVSGITVPSAGASIADPGPYTAQLESTSKHVYVSGALVILEGDASAKITATPKIPGSPPIDYQVTFRVRVADAGQERVVGE